MLRPAGERGRGGKVGRGSRGGCILAGRACLGTDLALVDLAELARGKGKRRAEPIR